jgi:hypothetical protein
MPPVHVLATPAAPSAPSPWAEQAEAAWLRLQDKGLISAADAHGSFSLRMPGADTLVLVEAGAPASFSHAIAAQGGVPGLHAAVYQERPDVGAVFISHQTWATRLADLGEDMPAVFDEQVRHLGRQVVCPGLPIAALPSRADSLLRGGANAYVFDDVVLCLGMTRERVVFNAELLEKCAKAFVLASLTGQRVNTLPGLVRFIANRRLLKDEKRAAQAHARGEVPTGLNAY